MKNSLYSTAKASKRTLILIVALSFVFVAIFWAVIQSFHLQGLILYFMQLGLYLILFLVALWGLKVEKINLSINLKRIVEALAWTLAGWLVYLLAVRWLGGVNLSEDFAALKTIPVGKIGANLLSTWLFVGFGEEVLFRGYFTPAFMRHFTRPTGKHRKASAMLLASVFFSLWHLPSRIMWLITGEGDLLLVLVSLVVLFALGFGYTWLYVRSDNILLPCLLHGVSDLPLVGMSSQMAPVILVVAIGCVELQRLVMKKKGDAFYSVEAGG